MNIKKSILKLLPRALNKRLGLDEIMIEDMMLKMEENGKDNHA